MNRYRRNQLLVIAAILSVAISSVVRPPSTDPVRDIKTDSIAEKTIKIDPGQILNIKFNEQLYNIQSIKVERQTKDGWQDRTINDYQKFLDEDRYDLGGCVAYQAQGEFKKLMTAYITLNQASNNNQAKFTDVLFFPEKKKFLMLGSDYFFYSFGYISLYVEKQDALQVTISQGINFKSQIVVKENEEPWVKGIVYKGVGYIFTSQKAFRLRTEDVKDVVSDLQFQDSYMRETIHDLIIFENQIWAAVGIDGIDTYSIQKNGNLEKTMNYNKKSELFITNLIQSLPLNCEFDIVKIKMVKQGQDTVVLLQENNEGIHVLLMGVGNEDPNVYTYTYRMDYKYFISVKHISSFDAHRFTMAITLSSKTFQSGLEIFFDLNDYYINYFEDDELAVDDVVLDHNSNTGIWIGDDVSKGYRHSIFRDNLQYSKQSYEDYIDLTGNNHVFFFQEGDDNLIFTLGQRRLEIFNLTNVVPKVICSSSEGGLDEKYRITFISQYCGGDQSAQEVNAKYLFNNCQVSMNLNFQTNNVAVTSANIGLIVGLTIGLFVILVIVLVLIIRCYKRNKSEINVLEERKKQYMNIESDDHKNMKENQQQQQQQDQVQINFAIQ